MAVEFWIANTVSDLIQGDVLGLGTTSSIDNGELTFLQQPGGDTTIWKCQASDGGIRALRSRGHLHHEYPDTTLEQLERLVLYPLQRIHNRGALDVSDVGPGQHRLEVLADLEQQILEAAGLQANNRAVLELAL